MKTFLVLLLGATDPLVDLAGKPGLPVEPSRGRLASTPRHDGLSARLPSCWTTVAARTLSSLARRHAPFRSSAGQIAPRRCTPLAQPCPYWASLA